jgi:hypothetical protein
MFETEFAGGTATRPGGGGGGPPVRRWLSIEIDRLINLQNHCSCCDCCRAGGCEVLALFD